MKKKKNGEIVKIASRARDVAGGLLPCIVNFIHFDDEQRNEKIISSFKKETLMMTHARNVSSISCLIKFFLQKCFEILSFFFNGSARH
jgi:hypothetical protein